jgi:hypothetical protein
MLGLTMPDWIKTLNDNSGAIVAVTASVSAILTVLLLIEARATRNTRLEAAVEARAKCHTQASFLLELEVRNFGPANARNVVMTYYLADPDGKVEGETRRQAETLLGSGEGRRFLPGTPGDAGMLAEMGQKRLALSVEWSWEDGRRRLWFFPLRHREKRTWATADLARDFFEGWALTDRDSIEDLHEIAEKLQQIESHQKASRQALEGGLKAIVRALKEEPTTPVNVPPVDRKD